MKSNRPQHCTDCEKALQSFPRNEGLFEKIIDLFPYPIHIYSADGTSVMVNQALLRDYRISDMYMIVGKYNVFEDSQVVINGISEAIKRVFEGEPIQLLDVKFPVEDIVKRYNIKDYDVEALYHDISAFPLFDDVGKVKYVVSMMIERRVYRDKSEITKGKEYIETHWKEPFNIDKISESAGLSRTHFIRLFIKHTNHSPHDYYIKIKVDKIREKLMDRTLSISQAFSLCGVDYNGHYAKMYKKRTGQTPTEFRKIIK